MPSATGFYPRLFGLGVATALGFALWRIFAPFAAPIAWAAFLAFLLFPLNARLRRRFRGRAGFAAGVLTVLAPVVVLLPLAALSIEFVAQITGLLRKLQEASPNFEIRSWIDPGIHPWVAGAYSWVQAHDLFSAAEIQQWLVSAAREALQRAAGFGGTFFLGALTSIAGIALMLMLLFFFLRDGDAMLGRMRAWIPLDEDHKERLFAHLAGITRAIVYGTTLIALLQGLVLGIGFSIAGLASPVVFGVVGALLAMLPLGGTALIWLPAVLWLFVDGRWGYGIFMAAWGLMLSGLDNILKPLLISGRAPVSTLVVFIGVLGGISAFGAIGIIAGPIILSLALALIAYAEEAGWSHGDSA
ncbi:MAG: AI-2E family transporter [Gammaproteobacteria bacterium]|nr:AI-2E family transporter [Gammaproteobacteria bacterium]MDE2347340.1 AI-2E family transporter [Gammaproteobacteria bacterium]